MLLFTVAVACDVVEGSAAVGAWEGEEGHVTKRDPIDGGSRGNPGEVGGLTRRIAELSQLGGSVDLWTSLLLIILSERTSPSGLLAPSVEECAGGE